MVHPSIRELFLNLNRHPVFQDIVQRLHARHPLHLSGLTPAAKALYSVLLWQVTERPILMVVDGNKQAEVLFETIDSFFQLLVPVSRDRSGPQLLPALDVIPGQAMSPHAEILQTRATALWRLAHGQAPITVTPVASALLRMERPQHYRQLAQFLKAGDEIPLEDLTSHLESVGYEKREPVEMVGEYSVRGGILDVFSPEADKPVRLELFGDEIESIRQFDVESQRSVLKVNSCTLLPLTPFQKSRAVLAELAEKLRDEGMSSRELPLSGDTFPGWELMLPLVRRPEASLFDFFERPIVMWDEPELARAAAERHWKRMIAGDRAGLCPPDRVFMDWDEMHRVAQGNEIEVRMDLSADPALRFHIPTRPSMAFHGNMQVAIAEARTLIESGNRVVFFGLTTGEVERVADIMHEYGVVYQLGLDQNESTPEYLAGRAYMGGSAASVFLVKGRVPRGTVFTDAKLVTIGSEDLFDASDMVARPTGPHSGPKISTGAFSADQFDLRPGDYVVHAEHGIGQFIGLKEIAQGEAKGDYMLLEYAAGSKLYVPLTRMDLIQRFRGEGEAAPRLDSMGGLTWNRTKSKVKAKMRDMAEELLKLYAQRKTAQGFAYSSDSNWQREFDDAFEFAETRDQKSAIDDIKRDMESDQPMDRLLCGDVGYGKTEVVMRAAFKALGDGKQVAVLAPTTVLAFQHFETFKRRFQSFPVRIEMLSRFRTAKEIKQALEEIAEGKVDIAIGTHRLFSKDVEFKDLGLVIVDEEQRFGVKHKERLKQLKHSVDVITMSATPIPRTLHMSMLGLRDMSVIETPPKDRLAIQTVVAQFQPGLVKSAIELEVGRGGQVYFVHNRIDSIFSRASSIQELAPNARIGVGHGQMGEAALEKTMLAFMRHEFDVLVSTTIVENGLDIPLANTIIIENADKHGLAELYQLRGRVGRSNRRAYAYLLVPEDTELTEIARKRLAALKEFSDLGAGFKIAALDLELRGAGNLLGGEQHGHINSVGFDMYVRMLDETVRELKGEEIAPEIRSVINLALDIRIPPEYIGDENQRLKAYKRIASAATAEEREKVETELEDRYGPVPEEVRNLLLYSALKTAAESLGVENIERRALAVQFKFSTEARVDARKLAELVSKTQGAQFTPAGVLRVPLDRLESPGAVLEFVKDEVLERLR